MRLITLFGAVSALALLSTAANARPLRNGAISDYRACYKGLRELSAIDGVDKAQSPWKHLLVSGVDDSGIEHGESIDYKLELGGNSPQVVLLTERKYIEIPFDAKKYQEGKQSVALKLPSGKSVILNFSVTRSNVVGVESAFFMPESASIELSGSYSKVINTNGIRSAFDPSTSDFTNTVRALLKTLPEKFAQAEKSLIESSTFTDSANSGVPYLKARFDAVLAACEKSGITEPGTPDESLVEPLREKIGEKYQHAMGLLEESRRPHGKHATVTDIN